MPKVLRYSQTWFDCDAGGNSYPKYAAGQCYPLHEDADRHITAGIAEAIDVRIDGADAADKAEKAQAKADAAVAAAGQAQDLANLALAAEEIAGRSGPEVSTV